jgi:prevent-host-death family protein
MSSEPAKRQRTISATEFKAQCLAIMDEVMRTGDEFLITKHGRVVARLVAPEGAIPSAHGWMRGTVSFVGDPTEPDDVWSLRNSLFPGD